MLLISAHYWQVLNIIYIYAIFLRLLIQILDLSTNYYFLFRKVSLRLFRKAEKIINNEKQIEILEGIYEPKRFLLKRGSWTSGKVVLKVDNTKSNVNNIKNNSKENITKANFKVKEDYKISKKEDELKSLKLGLKNPSDTNIEEMNVKLKDIRLIVPIAERNVFIKINLKKMRKLTLKFHLLRMLKMLLK